MPKKKKQKEEVDIQPQEEEIDAYDQLESGLEEEGQLAVDVYQDKDSVIIKSTIAGVEPEDVEVSFDNDMITIRGKRQKDRTIEEQDYFYQECYWGGFSRSIILPVEVKPDKIEATIKNGILTITLPKAKKKDLSIRVKDDN